MLIVLGMLGVFYAIVIGILYATQQRTRPSFDEYSVGGRSYGPWYVAMSYVNSWWPGSTFIAFFGLAAGAGVFGLYGLAYSTLGVATMYFMATAGLALGRTVRPALPGRPARPAVQLPPGQGGGQPDRHRVPVPLGRAGHMQAFGEIFRYASGDRWPVTACLLVGLAVIVVAASTGRSGWACAA